MVIIQVLNEVGEFVAIVVDVILALMLEVFSFKQIEELLLQNIFSVDHLAPLFNLVPMLLDSTKYHIRK